MGYRKKCLWRKNCKSWIFADRRRSLSRSIYTHV